MTTPEERRRNWIWGHQMLGELAQDEQLPISDRRLAAALLAAYPAEEQLAGMDAEHVERLPVDFADLLTASRHLFSRLHVDDGVAEGRRRALLVILRHFR